MIVSEADEVVDELFNVKEKPDAIFAWTDKLTTNCLCILKANAISVPNDISLLGFFNTDLTELLDQPFSIIKQPTFEMGEVSINLLLQMIKSKRPVTEFETKVLTKELLIRGYTKKTMSKSKVIA